MKVVVALAFAVLLTGCAGILQVTDWKPALDHATDAHPGQIAQDERECKVLDSAYTGYGILELIPNLIMSAAGALSFGSAPKSSSNTGDEYKHIYSACMAGRGHKVLN